MKIKHIFAIASTLIAVRAAPIDETDANLRVSKEQGFGFLPNLDFSGSTLKTLNAFDHIECAKQCGAGCDFITFNPGDQTCRLKYTDKSANTGTFFYGTESGFMPGELLCDVQNPKNRDCVLSETRVETLDECGKECDKFTDCNVMIIDWNPTADGTTGGMLCRLQQLERQNGRGFSLGFSLRNEPQNANEEVKGRFDIIGSSGVVGIHANLLADGRVLFTARPEQKRGGPNQEMVARPNQVPFGEISSIFDPISGKLVPSFIDDNLFCHGSILVANGNVFTSGGDVGSGENEAATGLIDGLYKQRVFDYKRNMWFYDEDMKRSRWYPSPMRTVDGSILIFGGAVNATGGKPETTVEIYRPGSKENLLKDSPLLIRTGAAWYPQVLMIPHSGNAFMFARSNWAIVDAKSGNEIETESEAVDGIRSGEYPAGMVMLPLHPENNYRAEIALFGGTVSEKEQVALDTVARLAVTDPTGQKHWTYDKGRMPHGRIVSNAILQPNGKLLLFNGAQLGKTGGDIAKPFQKAAALHVFQYDPQAEDGNRFKVLNWSPIQRLYHSSALLLPDGRTLIAGTDQATYDEKTSYEHRVEAFTPPWLLDGSSRPVINRVPGKSIKYGSTFVVDYSSNVTITGASLVTPGSSTHGVDFTQRLVFLEVAQMTDDQIALIAPPDATIALQGYHMLFLLAGDTPSEAKFVHLS